jgi:hyperosmotically inducible protein
MRNPIKTSLVVIGLALGGSLAACAQTATNESTGAYVDDTAITTKVKAAIFDDSTLKVLDIHVTTTKNVVQLSGFVSSRPMIGHASDVVGKVAGVRSVQNDLVVRQ